MDEEVGKGECHSGQGSYMDPFRAGQGGEGPEGQNCLSNFLVSFGSHGGVFYRSESVSVGTVLYMRTYVSRCMNVVDATSK